MCTARVTAAIAKGKHPVPSRTRKLSLSAPMVLQPRGCGRVGRRRTFFPAGPPVRGWPSLHFRPFCRGRLFVHSATSGRVVHQASCGVPPDCRRPPRGRAVEVMCDDSTDRQKAGRRRVADGQRGAAGRAGVPAARGAGAPERGHACGRSGWWSPRPPRRGRRTSDGRRARVRRVDGAGAAVGGRAGRPDDVVEVSGALRRRFFRAGGAVGVAGGGRDDVGPGHSSRSERMSTPTLGLGWKEVAFSGQQPVGGGDPQHLRRSRAPASAPPRPCAPCDGRERLVDGVVVADRAGRACGSAGIRSLVQDLDRERGRGGRSSARVAQSWPSVATSVSGPSAATAGLGVAGRRTMPAPVGAPASVVERRSAEDPVDRAEEERGVVLVDQHRQPGVGGRRPGGRLLQPQVGGVAVVAVGDQRASVGASAGVERRRARRGRGSPRRGGAARPGR